MTVYGKLGKRWYCFPPFPQTLEIDKPDSHIPHRPDYDGNELNIPKTGRYGIRILRARSVKR